MVHAIALESPHISRVIGTIIVTIDNTIGYDLLANARQKRLEFGLRNRGCIDRVSTLPMPKPGILRVAPRPRFPFPRLPK